MLHVDAHAMEAAAAPNGWKRYGEGTGNVYVAGRKGDPQNTLIAALRQLEQLGLANGGAAEAAGQGIDVDELVARTSALAPGAERPGGRIPEPDLTCGAGGLGMATAAVSGGRRWGAAVRRSQGAVSGVSAPCARPVSAARQSSFPRASPARDEGTNDHE